MGMVVHTLNPKSQHLGSWYSSRQGIHRETCSPPLQKKEEHRFTFGITLARVELIIKTTVFKPWKYFIDLRISRKFQLFFICGNKISQLQFETEYFDFHDVHNYKLWTSIYLLWVFPVLPLLQLNVNKYLVPSRPPAWMSKDLLWYSYFFAPRTMSLICLIWSSIFTQASGPPWRSFLGHWWQKTSNRIRITCFSTWSQDFSSSVSDGLTSTCPLIYKVLGSAVKTKNKVCDTVQLSMKQSTASTTWLRRPLSREFVCRKHDKSTSV